jgi:hypothetical protein
MNKMELVQAVSVSHRKIEDTLEKISPDKMEISSSSGEWTVKETLVHLTFWERTLLEDYSRLKRGEPLVELQGDGAMDTVNGATLLKAKTMPLAEVLEDFNSTFQQLTDWLAGLDPGELDRPFMYGMSLGGFIQEDTWKHYDEHLPLLNSKRTE